MSYLALARKWRPRSFAELVGQEHVRQALGNALTQGRVHHAFLFTGTRGVGKTTIARILSKCLNCETGVTATPCGVCSSCKEIDEGRFVDLIEVDAASRTKVDDTRELLENVQYSPTRGRYKVYLIDEVHMLSTHSFNALLKTLEEPPPHVKFLLATTDPQKLPVTVLSRCLQFNLKRLPVALISEHMVKVLGAEKIVFEPAALRLVAQAADGSMRDALSLLDQLIAFGGGKVDEASARGMLGTIDRDHVARLARSLATADAAQLLETARTLEEFSPDYGQVLDDLAAVLTRVALLQLVPAYEGDELFDAALLKELAAAISAEDVQLYYQTAILGRRDLPFAPDPRTGFEMTLVRMLAFRPAGGAGANAGSASGSGARAAAASNALPSPSTAPIVRPASAGPIDPVQWSRVIGDLDVSGAARQLATNCALIEHSGSTLRLAIDPKVARTAPQIERLTQALAKYLGAHVKLEFVAGAAAVETPSQHGERRSAEALDAARRVLEDDPTVRDMKTRFGATLHPESVRPTEEL
ncbi:MAG TPA: DNA polymerase III subunit gamma/tau [Steroidobacteraceae bacterium]|jgi:DNA polymerase-3 subunit gamma/tau|nr:DNA polymerase III subunit gamma/tau [Steroidobacteraceae bacterium]